MEKERVTLDVFFSHDLRVAVGERIPWILILILHLKIKK